MGTIFTLLAIVGIVAYIINIMLNPEKHIVALVIFAIIYGIFGAFYDATGAKDDFNRKKKG